MSKDKKVSIEVFGTDYVIRCGKTHLHKESMAVISRNDFIRIVKKNHPEYIITNEVEEEPALVEASSPTINGEVFKAIVPMAGQKLTETPLTRKELEAMRPPLINPSIFEDITPEEIAKTQEFVIRKIDETLDKVDEETGEYTNLGEELDTQVKSFEESLTPKVEVKQTVQDLPYKEVILETDTIEENPQTINSNTLNSSTMKTNENQASQNEAQAQTQAPKQEQTSNPTANKPNAIVRASKMGLGYGVVSVTAPTHFIFKSIGDIAYGIAEGIASVEVAGLRALNIMEDNITLEDGTQIPLTKDIHKRLIFGRTCRYQDYATYPLRAGASIFKKKEAKDQELNVQPNVQTA